MLRCLMVALCLVFTGCTSPAFYLQAINGQHEILDKAEPIDVVLERSSTPYPLKQKLSLLKEIRLFASDELFLPDNNSYKTYTALKRPFVTWNVFAADELSVSPKTWCFFVVGCVGYRGYFSKVSAEAYASKLKAQGYDTYIGGVPAYSTLGHFDDPALSTFIYYPEAELAGLIFHELAHQLLYIKDDSMFNESFAATIEEEGVKRWISRRGSNGNLDLFYTRKKRYKDYVSLLSNYKDKLSTLYNSHKSLQEKRNEKEHVFAALKQDYQLLKQQWNNYSGYDYLFSLDLNNAFVASTSLYTQLVPAFQALLIKHNNDLKAFYEEVKKIALEPKVKREILLQQLIKEDKDPLVSESRELGLSKGGKSIVILRR